jgi:hypothetical protein
MARLVGWTLALWASTAAAADPHDFIGAERCGSQCHAPQYEAWRKGPHADTLRALSGRQLQDPTCLSCHAMVGPGPDQRTPLGVQCESCHGAGRAYAPSHVMRDPVLAKLMGLEPVTEQTCAQCHQPSAPSVGPFSYAEAVRKVCFHARSRPDRTP